MFPGGTEAFPGRSSRCPAGWWWVAMYTFSFSVSVFSGGSQWEMPFSALK